MKDPEDLRCMEQFIDVGVREFAEATWNGDRHLANYWAKFTAATFRMIHESEQEQDAR